MDERSAVFSPCRTWRYLLTRRWADGPLLNVIGLNPSTADETQDDPTIRRCIGFARDWGYGGLWMTNIYAYRSTDPRGLKDVADPVGPENDHYLYATARAAGLVVAAWGLHGNGIARRADAVLGLLDVPVHCLGVTKGGDPRHPLYLRRDVRPVPFGLVEEVAL